jgi:hypothetical protein
MLRLILATVAAARAVLVFGEAAKMQEEPWAEQIVTRLRRASSTGARRRITARPPAPGWNAQAVRHR